MVLEQTASNMFPVPAFNSHKAISSAVMPISSILVSPVVDILLQ